MPYINSPISLTDHVSLQRAPITEPPTYLPQLDGLRTLAVIPVLIQHWGGSHLSLFTINVGGYGVGLFFVLSGFLITRILLAQRRGSDNSARGLAVRQFWIRRVLRIFPLYYAVLIAGCAFNIEGFRAFWNWHALYLTNFLFDSGKLAYSTHFWTLSVEEQFYLAWPLIVLFFGRKALYVTTFMLILTAPCYRILPNTDAVRSLMPTSLLPAQLDYLGLGALLALLLYDFDSRFVRTLARVLMATACIGFTLLTSVTSKLGWLNHTCLAMFCCALIYFVSAGSTNWLQNLLKWEPLVRIGKISYGIYVLHMLAPAFWDWLYYSAPIPGYRILPRLGIQPELHQLHWFKVAAWLIITMSFSCASWFLFESRILALKRYFPYTIRAESDRDSGSRKEIA